jgi:hypothetical protein
VHSLTELFPPPKELLELEPEDLAPLLLRYLSLGPDEDLSLYNVVRPGSDLHQYADQYYNEVARAVTEAWMVLEREGLLAPNPTNPNGGWRFITKRGKSLQTTTDFQAYLKGGLLPTKSLDPALATKVSSLIRLHPLRRGPRQANPYVAQKLVRRSSKLIEVAVQAHTDHRPSSNRSPFPGR